MVGAVSYPVPFREEDVLYRCTPSQKMVRRFRWMLRFAPTLALLPPLLVSALVLPWILILGILVIGISFSIAIELLLSNLPREGEAVFTKTHAFIKWGSIWHAIPYGSKEEVRIVRNPLSLMMGRGLQIRRQGLWDWYMVRVLEDPAYVRDLIHRAPDEA